VLTEPIYAARVATVAQSNRSSIFNIFDTIAVIVVIASIALIVIDGVIDSAARRANSPILLRKKTLQRQFDCIDYADCANGTGVAYCSNYPVVAITAIESLTRIPVFLGTRADTCEGACSLAGLIRRVRARGTT